MMKKEDGMTKSLRYILPFLLVINFSYPSFGGEGYKFSRNMSNIFTKLYKILVYKKRLELESALENPETSHYTLKDVAKKSLHPEEIPNDELYLDKIDDLYNDLEYMQKVMRADYQRFINGKERTLIPEELITLFQSVVDKDEKEDEDVKDQRDEFLNRIIFGLGIGEDRKSFFGMMKELNFANWRPFQAFFKTFKESKDQIDTPSSFVKDFSILFNKIFRILSVEEKLRILGEVFADLNKIKTDTDLAMRLFQSLAPLEVKILQELQERMGGGGKISKLLDALKKAKAMPKPLVKEIAENFLLHYDGQAGKSIHIDKNLGVASIANAWLAQIGGKTVVIKVRRENIDYIYAHGQITADRISNDKRFDRGIKNYVEGSTKGIGEELDLSKEAENIILAQSCYYRPDEGDGVEICPISIPKEFGIEILNSWAQSPC